MNKHVTLTIRWQRFEAYGGSTSRLKPFVAAAALPTCKTAMNHEMASTCIETMWRLLPTVSSSLPLYRYMTANLCFKSQPPLSSVVRIQKARTTLLLDHPFFGTLLFRLGALARSSIATMATDGVSLYFNPQFVETLSAAEIAGTLAHEVMHPALQHHRVAAAATYSELIAVRKEGSVPDP
jgi:Putative metallopeptidase domain